MAEAETLIVLAAFKYNKLDTHAQNVLWYSSRRFYATYWRGLLEHLKRYGEMSV